MGTLQQQIHLANAIMKAAQHRSGQREQSLTRLMTEDHQQLLHQIRLSRVGQKQCNSWWKVTSGRCTFLQNWDMVTVEALQKSGVGMFLCLRWRSSRSRETKSQQTDAV